MTQARGSGARFELFLPAQRQFIFEQQAKPFGVIEAARLCFVFEFLKTLREAMKTKRVQLFEPPLAVDSYVPQNEPEIYAALCCRIPIPI